MNTARSRAGQSDAEAQAAWERRLHYHLTWELEDLMADGKGHIPAAVNSQRFLRLLEASLSAREAPRGRVPLRVVS